jgi:hypothetical protein
MITGIDGTRYAARQQAVSVVHDADGCHDEPIVQLRGAMLFGCRAPWTNCWRGSRRSAVLTQPI